jgi:hypothetical protein
MSPPMDPSAVTERPSPVWTGSWDISGALHRKHHRTWENRYITHTHTHTHTHQKYHRACTGPSLNLHRTYPPHPKSDERSSIQIQYTAGPRRRRRRRRESRLQPSDAQSSPRRPPPDQPVPSRRRRPKLPPCDGLRPLCPGKHSAAEGTALPGRTQQPGGPCPDPAQGEGGGDCIAARDSNSR